MIYRFTIISDEVDDFVREIQIDPEATFYDFHEAILKSVGYTNDQMTSFFICDDDWEKGKEVTLEEMDDNPEIDSWVMKDTTISELVEDEKQKLLYVFDYITDVVSSSNYPKLSPEKIWMAPNVPRNQEMLLNKR